MLDNACIVIIVMKTMNILKLMASFVWWWVSSPSGEYPENALSTSSGSKSSSHSVSLWLTNHDELSHWATLYMHSHCAWSLCLSVFTLILSPKACKRL